MDKISLAIWKACNLAKRSSAGDVVAAVVDAADGPAGAFGVVHCGWREGGRRWNIAPPILTFTFIHAAALAVKLAEGGPKAGLPPHKLDHACSHC